MKKIFLSFAVITAFTIVSCGGSGNADNTQNESEPTEEICFYSYDEGAGTQVRWTAFKTEAKVGVGGQFNKVNVSAGDKSTKITDIIRSIKFNIPTASTNTANEARDEKIINSFFGAMEATDLILGQVKSVEGDNLSGACTFYLTLNNIEKEAELHYNVTDNLLKLYGSIDINNWNGQDALVSLNEVCSEAHKGDGAESVTWPTVDIEIETTLKKVCH